MKTYTLLLLCILSNQAFTQCLTDTTNSTYRTHHIGGAAVSVGEYFEGNFTFYIPYGTINDPQLLPANGFAREVSIWAIDGLPPGIQFEAYFQDGTMIDTTGMADTSAIRYPIPVNGYLRLCIRLFGTPTVTTTSYNSVKIIISHGMDIYPFPILQYKIDFVVFDDIYTPQICIVNTDLESGNNQVIWNKLQSNATDTFNIYSSLPATPSQIELIGQVAYEDLSVFTDTVNDPQNSEINYFLSVVNNNGEESSLSQKHTNIHLRIDTVNGEMAFNWNEYYPYISPIDDYIIYSGSTPDNLHAQQDLPNWMTGWTMPISTSLTYYSIRTTFGTTCAPSRSNDEQVFSNIVSNAFLLSTYDAEMPVVRFYPNPTSSLLTIETDKPTGTYQLQDITGKHLLSGNITSTKFNLDISAFSNGMYILNISDGQNWVNRKIIKE